MSDRQTAIERLYDAFKTLPKPRHVEGCPCCTSDGEFRQLVTKPLREVMPDQLSRYASKALTTVGTEQDFQYFIPRILEICATEFGWWPEPAVVTGKMEMAAWKTWPAEQISAIRMFLWEHFLHLLTLNDSGSDVDEWICAVGKTDEDLSPYLAELERHPAKLLQFYEENSRSLLKGRLSNSFWENGPKEKVVANWFRSPGVIEIIDEKYGMK